MKKRKSQRQMDQRGSVGSKRSEDANEKERVYKEWRESMTQIARVAPQRAALGRVYLGHIFTTANKLYGSKISGAEIKKGFRRAKITTGITTTTAHLNQVIDEILNEITGDKTPSQMDGAKRTLFRAPVWIVCACHSPWSDVEGASKKMWRG